MSTVVPLEVLLKRELTNERIESPDIMYGNANKSKKGEDFMMINADCERIPGDPDTAFASFAIFDGHNGKGAAQYSNDNLLENVLSAIPPDLSRDEWIVALPRALVAGFVKTDKDFQQHAQSSGTTVTFVIVDGWIVTVASVGDSRCVLESTEGTFIYLSADHRLEENEEEVERITASGGDVGKVNTGAGIQVGPLRCWPGGLCLSRSIGDFNVGEFIVPIPYVKQVKLPPSCGGRLIIASDGVWDAISPEVAFSCCRGLSAEDAPAQIIKEAIQASGLRDDTTCIVVDILAPEKTSLIPQVHKKQGKGHVFKAIFGKKTSEPSSNADKEYIDEPDRVEEIFEEGSAVLADRLGAEYPVCNMFKLFMCAVCQIEMKPGEGISVHAGSSNQGRLRPWDGPFLCSSCQTKKRAMEGRLGDGEE